MKEEIEENSKSKAPLKSVKFDMIGKTIPQYQESVNMKGGFINFGEDNLMPNYYISLLDRSPKHNAIIHQKAAMVGGNGISRTDLSNEALKFISNSMNEDDLDELVAKISMDLEVYGGFLLNVVWSNDRTKIAEINYMNPQTMRIVKPDDKKPDDVERYLISRDWDNINKAENKPVEYPGFSTVDRTNASQLLYCKTYQPGKYFYASPEYISGSRWIEMEFEISQFHLSNIRNGFAPSMFINFPTGVPTDEQMSVNDRKLIKSFGGAMGGGKVFITYSETPESAPKMEPINTNDNDTKFIELNEIITEGILGSHRVVNPALFGLGKPDGLFIGQTDILNSLELFKAQYVIPRQRFIEKCLNRLARINGITDKIKLNEYEMNFAKMDMNVSDTLSILTSPISDDSKKSLLLSSGYTEDEVDKLVKPLPTPPAEPTKNNPI